MCVGEREREVHDRILLYTVSTKLSKTKISANLSYDQNIAVCDSFEDTKIVITCLLNYLKLHFVSFIKNIK